MLQSVSTVNTLKLIFIVSPLTVISFLRLNQRILFITKNWLCITKGYVLKGCVPRKMHLENTLKVYVLGLASVVIPKNVLTVQLGGFLKENQSKTGISVPLVVTYYPWFHNLSNTIRKLFIYLYVEEQVKKVFASAPLVLFRSGYSLRSHLVCAKVYPLIWEKGSSCCGKSRCETFFNIQETTIFKGTIINVRKRLRQKVALPNKMTFISIFWERTIMYYLRIVR